jgi:adenine-specific DNA methylase
LFQTKLLEFFSLEFVAPAFSNKAFNMDFEALLALPEIQSDVDLIYADPPYTDMQYSRYYHLLNFVTRYEPLPLTMIGGAYTKGRYTEGRYQSKLSVKSTCLNTFTSLIDFSHAFHKNLIISFAYPANVREQKTDRYVMSIDALISACSSRFGAGRVEVNSCDYTHSNNRNSEHKKVREYLVVCKST